MSKKKNKVLLIGWDAADWKVISPLLDKGEMNHLAVMIESGVMGNLQTLNPVLSPMLWNSIASGKRADKHGILGFTTVDETTGNVRPFGTQDRQVKAFWNILHQEGYRCHVVNWFCGHPAEPLNGTCVTELVARQCLKGTNLDPKPELPPDTVHPESLRQTFADLRVWPEDIDGDTMSLFVPKIMEVDQEKDRRPTGIAEQLAECLTTHAITTWILENEEWDVMAVYYPEIDHICHGFMQYHPPRQTHIAEKDFDLYHEVVNSIYRLHDLLLGRLLQLVDDHTTVILCSDHGFHPDHLRPKSVMRVPTGPADQHRPIGIFAMKGPGVKQDELVHGAGLLDIAPTILSIFNLPLGEDMEGRVLIEAFEQEMTLTTIPSWEQVEGETGMLDKSKTLSPEETETLLQQFVDLGYIEPLAGNKDRDAAITRAECDWNLARVYMSTDRYMEALPLLEQSYRSFPLRFDIGVRLTECLSGLGLNDEAKELAEQLAGIYPNRPWIWILLGQVEVQLLHREKALATFQRADEKQQASPSLFIQLGRCYLGLRNYDSARQAFAKTLEINPESPGAHHGMALCDYHCEQYASAVEHALVAVGLEFNMPRAHLTLGMAFSRNGEIAEAIRAFETCIQLQPNNLNAHRLLAVLYRKTERREDARASDVKVHEIWESRMEQRAKRKALRTELANRNQAWFSEREVEEDDLAAGILDEEQRPKPRKLPERPGSIEPGSSGKEFIIVSGLPRSGTSLMMQILKAGGLEPMTDQLRQADDDNPKGYFEWEAVKKLERNPRLIEEAEGKAIKVISLLLARLPAIHRYKVLFLDRPVEEIASSQAKMIEHRTGQAKREKPEMLHRHSKAILEQLEKVPYMDHLNIPYNNLVEDPEQLLEQVRDFVGPEQLPYPDRMKGVIDPTLYRNRSKSSN